MEIVPEISIVSSIVPLLLIGAKKDSWFFHVKKTKNFWESKRIVLLKLSITHQSKKLALRMTTSNILQAFFFWRREYTKHQFIWPLNPIGNLRVPVTDKKDWGKTAKRETGKWTNWENVHHWAEHALVLSWSFVFTPSTKEKSKVIISCEVLRNIRQIGNVSPAFTKKDVFFTKDLSWQKKADISQIEVAATALPIQNTASKHTNNCLIFIF